MKKFLAVILSLALALSLAACGGDSGPDVTALSDSYSALSTAYNDMVDVATANGWEQDEEVTTGLNSIVEKINTVQPVIEDPSGKTQEQIDALTQTCDDLTAWVADMNEVVSVPYDGAAATDADTTSGNPLDTMDFYAVPEGLAGTGWDFNGGCMDGVNMSDEDYTAFLEQYGGMLGIVFNDDTSVSIVQGGGQLDGTYAVADEATLTLDFPDAGLTYSALFTQDGQTPVMVLLTDDTGMNAQYFTQVSAG